MTDITEVGEGSSNPHCFALFWVHIVALIVSAKQESLYFPHSEASHSISPVSIYYVFLTREAILTYSNGHVVDASGSYIQ